jgi:hypothetical protein
MGKSGRGVSLATPSPPRAEAHERVELYLYCPSKTLRACYRVTFTFLSHMFSFCACLKISFPSSRVKKDKKTLEDGTNTLSRNVGKGLPFDAA